MARVSEQRGTEQEPTGSGVTRAAAYLLLLGLAILVLRQALSPVTNADTLFHLRFGHEFLSGHWSLRHPGSVTTLATQPWTPTQWLPQVVLAWFEDRFGLAGVSWLTALQVVGFAAAVLVLTRRRASLLVAATLTLLTVAVAAGGLSARPQVISYLLTAVTLDAWLRTREDGLPRWWLVPLTWVWAMSHGMWPLGPVIGAVAVVGGAWDRRTTARRAVVEAGVVGCSLLVGALTPVGPTVVRALFAVGERSRFIPEWGRTDFSQPGHWILAGLLVVYLALRLTRREEVTRTETLFVLVTAAWFVLSSRTVPVAAVTLAPFLASALQSRTGAAREPATRRERLGLGGACVALLAGLAVVLPGASVAPAPYPSIDRALDELPSGTSVIDEWSQGGYLLWRHPGLDVGMHGYLDTYTIAEIEAAQRLLAAEGDWRDTLAASGARYAVLARGTPLAARLEHDLGWRVVADEGGSLLLAAPTG